MGREGLFDHGVEDCAGGEDVELGTIDFMDFHALEGAADHFRVAEVFRAVGREGHRAAKT